MTHRHLRQPDVALILETWHRRDRHGDCASLPRLRYPLLRRYPRRSQCRAVRQFRPSAFDRRLLDMRRTHRRSLCPGDESRPRCQIGVGGWKTVARHKICDLSVSNYFLIQIVRTCFCGWIHAAGGVGRGGTKRLGAKRNNNTSRCGERASRRRRWRPSRRSLPHFCCIRRTRRWTATRLSASLASSPPWTSVTCAPNRSARRSSWLGTCCDTSSRSRRPARRRPRRFATPRTPATSPTRRAPRVFPSSPPRRDPATTRVATMTPTSAAKVPTPHPERRPRGSPTACPRRRRRRARASHIRERHPRRRSRRRAPTSRSSASPPPRRASAPASLPTAAARRRGRIAAVDDERRALRAALDASRAECVALRRQLGATARTRTIPRSAARPASPPSRIAPSDSAAAGGRRVPPCARGEVLAERLQGVGDVRGDGDASDGGTREARRAEAAAGGGERMSPPPALASATVAASTRLGTPNRGIHRRDGGGVMVSEGNARREEEMRRRRRRFREEFAETRIDDGRATRAPRCSPKTPPSRGKRRAWRRRAWWTRWWTRRCVGWRRRTARSTR